MRAVFTGMEATESKEYVVKHLIGRRNRSINRIRNALIEMHTPTSRLRNGVWVTDLAFDFQHSRAKRFLERVGRGLIFESHGLPYFEAEFGYVLNPPIPEQIREFGRQRLHDRRILGAIKYTVGNFDADGRLFIVAKFFDGVEFLIRFRRIHESSKP